MGRTSTALLQCLVVALHAALPLAQPPSELGFQVDRNVCGFNVDSSRIETCSNKDVCDSRCQRSTCEALVQFAQLAGGRLLEATTQGWPRNASKCETLREFGYCSWQGVSCCCLQPSLSQAAQQAANATAPACDQCQVVNGSLVGSVSGIKLKDYNLNGSLPELLAALEPLGQLGLFKISLQVRRVRAPPGTPCTSPLARSGSQSVPGKQADRRRARVRAETITRALLRFLCLPACRATA
jgi:hypothetical protein